MAAMEDKVASWMSENSEKVRNSSLQVVKIDGHGLEMKIQGRYAFQLMLPSAFFEDEDQEDEEEFFLAYSLEKQKNVEFDRKIQSLNEKVQAVKIGPDALDKVMGLVAATFSGAGKSKEAEERAFKSNSAADSPQLKAVMREFKNISAAIAGAAETGGEEFIGGIAVEIPDEADICRWHVRLNMRLFKGNRGLYGDLKEYARVREIEKEKCGVLLEVLFPKDFPFEPPFVRVVRPKFRFHTGHVTVGGSICMEVLTPSGWLPSFSMENVLVQVHHAIVEGGGRLDMGNGRDYSVEEAQSAFVRVARDHGWIK